VKQSFKLVSLEVCHVELPMKIGTSSRNTAHGIKVGSSTSYHRQKLIKFSSLRGTKQS